MTDMGKTTLRVRVGAGCLTAVGLVMGLAGTALAQDKPYEGITINVLTRPGPVIAGRLAERGVEFQEMTGAEVVVSEVPFSELFPSLITDWSTGTNSVDVGVFSSAWGVEMAADGLIENLDPYLAEDELIDVDDIAPYFREYNQKVGGSTYMLTIDGDFQMLYYRTDVLEQLGMEPPRTWDEYMAIAEAANGQDWNGDGEADYGSCIFKKRSAQSYFAVQSIAAAFVQTQGTGQGIYFDTETMTPTIDNAAWVEAFNIYKATGQYGPPDELNHDIGDTRALVQAGRCALMIDWGDIGPLSIEPAGEPIRDKVGAVVMPGTSRVLDRATGELVDCTPEICPYAEDGINHAPFAAFGGWSGAVNAAADDDVKQAAYDFLSYMNQAAQSNVDVTMGWTGYNPYRNSQFEDLQPWLDAGFSQAAAENYLGAISESLNHPNMASDLRIPGAAEYTGVILDQEVARFLANEITAEEAVARIQEAWVEITEDLGPEDQLELYKASLGITN